ncbi:MAG: hypothetical protein NUV70_03955 [Caldiserica bacterium]|nr:hypothetical protein [Caldisericota bacterium]
MGHPQSRPKGMELVIIINSKIGKAVTEANGMGPNAASLGLYQLTVFTQGNYSGTYALIDCTNPQVKYSDNVNASVFTAAGGPGFIQAGWIKNGPNVTERPGGHGVLLIYEEMARLSWSTLVRR